MNVTWSDFKSMKLPLWEVLIGGGAAVTITWAAFAWADELHDKQVKTQDQLDQLVTIVSASTSQNNETHEEQEENIERVERDFELLVREMEVRREIEGTNGS